MDCGGVVSSSVIPGTQGHGFSFNVLCVLDKGWSAHPKDLEKTLESKCLTRTYERTSHTTWTLNIKIRVYTLNNK